VLGRFCLGFVAGGRAAFAGCALAVRPWEGLSSRLPGGKTWIWGVSFLIFFWGGGGRRRRAFCCLTLSNHFLRRYGEGGEGATSPTQAPELVAIFRAGRLGRLGRRSRCCLRGLH
jgi:hypothetical protein